MERIVLADGTPMDRVVLHLPKGAKTDTLLDVYKLLAARHPHRLITAPMEVGKTALIAAWLNDPGSDARVTAVVDRVVLSRSLAERIDGTPCDSESLKQLGSGASGALACSQRAVMLIQSLANKLPKRPVRRHHVIFDEVQSIINTMYTGSETSGPERNRTRQAYRDLIWQAASVTYAQADITEAARQMLAWDAHSVNEVLLEIVIETPVERGQVSLVPSAHDLHELAKFLSDIGKRFAYATSSRQDAEAMHRMLRLDGHDALLVTARTKTLPRVQAWMADPNQNPPRILVYNTAACAGVSINPRQDGTPTYPTLLVNTSSQRSGPSLRDLMQLKGRVRGNPTIYLHVPDMPWQAVDASEVAHTLRRRHKHANEDLKNAAVRTSVYNNELARNYCMLRAESISSWAPNPRVSMVRALEGDGHRVLAPVVEVDASGFDWKQNARLARKESLERMFTEDRTETEKRDVECYAKAMHLSELDWKAHKACEYSTYQIEAMTWYAERERHEPISLLTAVASSKRALDVDHGERSNPPQDRRAMNAKANLVQAGFAAADLNLGDFLQGKPITAQSSKLGTFVAWARENAADLKSELDVRAPGTSKKARARSSAAGAPPPGTAKPRVSDIVDRGAMRTLSTLIARIGGEAEDGGQVKRASLRGGGRERIKSFRLSRYAEEALRRDVKSYERNLVVPDPLRFQRTPEQVVVGATPFAIDTKAYLALPEASIDVDALDHHERGKYNRQQEVQRDLVDRIKQAGPRVPKHVLVRANRTRRSAAGRLYVGSPSLQNVPSRHRHAFLPARKDDVFVSVDISASQPSLFAGLTGASGLSEIALGGYESLVARLFPGGPLEEARQRTKDALIAVLNGGDETTVLRRLRDADAAERFWEWFNEECAAFKGLKEAAQDAWDRTQPGDVVEFQVGPGFCVSVVKPPRKRVGTLLSAVYTGKEAEILDRLLVHLPRGCQLAIPMFDGLLVSCPREEAPRLAKELGRAMLDAARKSDVQVRCKVGVGENWAAAEASATIFVPRATG